jgi:glutathione S-transferase
MGLPYEKISVGFPPNAAYKALNPFGTVPYLQDGATSMSESIAMMLYVAQKYGPTEALPSIDDDRHAKVMQFTLLGEASLSSPMTPLLAEKFGSPSDQKRNWSVVGIESRINRVLERLADELGGRDFIVGDKLSLGDISVATALRIWTRGLGQILSPVLARYCDRLQQRHAFERALA